MNFALVVAAVALVVGATPEAPFSARVPQRQTYNGRFLRLEAAPYPPAGYRPQGEQFRLPIASFPLRQPQQPARPDPVYGPPEVATEEVTTEADVTTTEMPTTTEYVPRRVINSRVTTQDDVKVENQQAEVNQDSPDTQNAQDAPELEQEGVYYIYHPDGLLQRVVYATKAEDMGYTARLTYKDVEPIKDPIYTYDPETLAFAQIQL